MDPLIEQLSKQANSRGFQLVKIGGDTEVKEKKKDPEVKGPKVAIYGNKPLLRTSTIIDKTVQDYITDSKVALKLFQKLGWLPED